MVRYKSDSRVESQLRKKELQSSILQLRTNRKLQTEAKRKLKLNSNLKRKLVVYRENGKFYIDHFAAYALKLTNVRTVMMDNPQLFEIGIEELYRLQNDDNIEIEYADLKDKNDDRTNEDSDLSKTLEELEKGGYGIGVHGIDTGSIEQKESTAISITSKGLNINNNSKTILSTAISLGINDDIEQLAQNLTEYQFGNGKKMTVVIAVPLYIQNNNGEKIFLGFPEENRRTSGQQYTEHCILDQVCGNLRKIPAEFILGYVYEKQDGSDGFIKNEGHYSNINQEQQQELYQTISQNMNQFSRDINSLISNGNITQLENMREKMQKMNFPTYIVDNAIILAQRFKENELGKQDNEEKETQTSSSQIKSKRQVMLDNSQAGISASSISIKAKRIIMTDEPKKEASTNTTSSQNKNIRRILLDSYNELTISDLNGAKEFLREGIEHLKKSNEEKEI